MLILDVTRISNWERNSNKKNYESPLFSNELPRTRIYSTLEFHTSPHTGNNYHNRLADFNT